MSTPFFYTGLPRVRSGWVANLMTHGDSFCYHCLSREYDSVDGFVSALACTISNYKYVGNSEPGLSMEMFTALNERFPDSNWVITNRSVTDSFVAASTAFPKLAPIYNESTFLHAQHDLDEMKRILGPRCMEMEMPDLDSFEECWLMTKHLAPSFTLGYSRWKLLNKLRVETIGEKAIEEFAPLKKAHIKEVACLA